MPKPMPAVSLSRPGSGAFRVIPALTLKFDQIAVAWRAHHAGKHADGLRAVLCWTPDHLVHHAVDAEIVP
jgi:hypothetical protein